MAEEKKGGAQTQEKQTTSPVGYEMHEEQSFPQGGKTLTVNDAIRALQDIPGDKVLCLAFQEDWKNQQNWVNGPQKGMISSLSQDAQYAYLTVGTLV